MATLGSSIRIFSELFQRFKQLYPNVTLRPSVHFSEEIYTLVQKGATDIGFVTSYFEDFDFLYLHMKHLIVQEYEIHLILAKSNPIYSRLHIE